MAYNFNEHKHNFAVWTAARAVQRNFTTTSKIKQAIEASDLRQFSEDQSSCSVEDFDIFHKKCANQLITQFNTNGITDVSYGRAAKIISIYLKTTVILFNQGNCNRSQVIHPPIDSILLNNIAEKFEALKELKATRWTTLEKPAYWELVSKLRSKPRLDFPNFNWELEEFWRPESEK
jgi:hypothetical protein